MSERGQITTSQLQTFLQIAQWGSFSGAAACLDVAQPTISGRVRSLERIVGGPLFARRGRKVALTERGEAFRAYAERAIAVLDEGVVAAALGAAGQTGRVTLGVSDSALADSFLGAAVARFHRDHPGVEIAAEIASCGYLVSALDDRVVRLGFLPWSHDSPPYDTLEPLLRFRERLQVVASPRHPLAVRGDLTLEEVSRLAGPFLRLWWSRRSRQALDALGKLPEPARRGTDPGRPPRPPSAPRRRPVRPQRDRSRDRRGHPRDPASPRPAANLLRERTGGPPGLRSARRRPGLRRSTAGGGRQSPGSPLNRAAIYDGRGFAGTRPRGPQRDALPG